MVKWKFKQHKDSVFEHGYIGHIEDETGLGIASVSINSTIGSRVIGEQEARENGNLLAAAPDLLAACKRAREDEGICRKCFDTLGIAIVKAEGKTDYTYGIPKQIFGKDLTW